MEDFTYGLILLGTLVFSIILFVLYFKRKKPEVRKKFAYWMNSWGLTIIGTLLTLIHIATYFLDKTQFEFPQLIIGIGMMATGFFYIRKYKISNKE